jgi:hypothetical protein
MLRRMRKLWILVLLAGLAPAQDQPAETPRAPAAPQHDPLGFPITFNDEILTRNDVLRALGADITVLGNRNVLRTERDRVLRGKLAKQVAADLGMTVTNEEMDLVLRRQIDEAGGEAKFYERLSQQGQTLAGYEAEIAQRLLEEKLKYLFRNGIFQRQLLPARIRPTPEEIRIAYENDPARRSSKVRVHRAAYDIGLTRQERGRIALLRMDGEVPEKEIEERKAKLLQPRLDAVVRALKERKDGAPLGEMEGVSAEDGWVEVSTEPSERPEERFLQSGKTGKPSEPFARPDGYTIIEVIEREAPDARPANDPEVAARYEQAIRVMRSRKWEAIMNLRALDQATVRPEIVRQELRTDIVAELRQAEEALRLLGLH